MFRVKRGICDWISGKIVANWKVREREEKVAWKLVKFRFDPVVPLSFWCFQADISGTNIEGERERGTRRFGLALSF